ncbi:DUF3658 domain-containing protein [Methanogenium organophilum]|uniref:DUF3658 domain-containing protein n=1 Tax=Methanogenium organophilum TaxID=2199 RepID=A0A9X9S299_METOG|nr:DUF3658 domain-containing protein [Methanogenium organophilum]WAI00529.1 DUF3658 domain-containing protein [Methanogenium organophilum]
MHTGTQHITFSESGRGTVRHALKDTDCTVISLPDDLGIGPIFPYDSDTRIDFFRGLCPEDEFVKYAGEMKTLSETFWQSVSEAYEKRVVWFSRRSVMEYAGFLEFLSRQDDLSRIEIVDLTDGISVDDVDIYGGKPYRIVTDAIGAMRPEWIVAAVSTARLLREDEVAYYRAVWERLQEENACLRTLWRGQLYSAEEDIYDAFICNHVTDVWAPAARVVGEVLGQLSDEYHQTGDIYIYSRLLHLADMGKVTCRGDHKAMRLLEVKRNCP